MSTTQIQTLPTDGNWLIDSHHSTVSFAVRHHAVATFRSTFVNVRGSFDADERRLSGEVNVADITLTGLDQLKGHVLTPEFFDAERFPTLSFESTRLSQDRDELLIAGDLTLRGVTKPIVATGTSYGPRTVVQIPGGPATERIGLDLAASVDRRDFGVSFNNEVAQGITNLGWIVKIEANLELILS